MKRFHRNIANIMTFTGITMGIVAILLTIRYNMIVLSCLLIFMGAIIDRYDGIVARFLAIDSHMGETIDSLNDIITFGVAPMVIVFTYFDDFHPIVAFLPVIAYIFASVYRLARFHTQSDKMIVVGIPITVAAVVLVIYIIIFEVLIVWELFKYSLIIVLIFLAILMISNFKYKKI